MPPARTDRPADSPPGAKQAAPDRVRQEITQALREVAELAAGDRSPDAFYGELLARVVRVTGAAGAAVWIVGAGGVVHLFRHAGLGAALGDRSKGGPKRAVIQRERRRLAAWLDAPVSGVAAAQSVAADELVIASRVEAAGTIWGLLTVYLPPGADPAARLGLQKFADAVADAASDYQAARELRHWNQDRDAVSRLHDLTMALHRPWSRSEVLAEVAGEGRRFLDADRVAVATRVGRQYRIAAVSGAATLNRRSAELRGLERLVASAMRLGQPLFYEEPTAGQAAGVAPAARPPQVEAPLAAYLDESATRRLAVVPIDARGDSGAKRRPRAALVVEQMSDRPLDASSQSLWLLADHAGVAVDRATRVRRVPVIGPLLGVESARAALTRRWLPRGVLVALLAAAAVAALVFVPADYTVTVEGEMFPVTRRDVFAPVDGVVVKVHAQHGRRVNAGEVLATLRSPDLELERTRVRGALATAEQELAAAQTARLEAVADPSKRRSQSQLAAEALLHEQRIASLSAELALIDAERAKLRVTSPIAGSVVTWELEQTLAARPVTRGQRLVTVADLQGEWRLRLGTPDRRAEPILDAQRAATDGGVRVRFVTSGRPEQEHLAIASGFRLASEADPVTGENQLLFEARLADGVAPPDLRPGAGVTGKVECGRRPLGYVWLADLYHELRRRFF